jgi:hypothetical protein
LESKSRGNLVGLNEDQGTYSTLIRRIKERKKLIFSKDEKKFKLKNDYVTKISRSCCKVFILDKYRQLRVLFSLLYNNHWSESKFKRIIIKNNDCEASQKPLLVLLIDCNSTNPSELSRKTNLKSTHMLVSKLTVNLKFFRC